MKTVQEFIDFQESSSPERSPGLVTFGRAERKMKKNERIAASAAKKAGFKGGGARHTTDWRDRGEFHSTYPYDKYGDNFKHPPSNTQIDTEINTIASGRKAAVLDTKGSKRTSKKRQDGSSGEVLAPTKETVRKMKEFRRRIVKSGGQERNPVHKVDFIPRTENDPEKNKLDKTAFKRGRNFHNRMKDLPNELKRAGAKRGDVVVGKPAAMMSGEDPKKGAAVRQRLYLRKFGRNVKGSDKSGRTSSGVIGSVNEMKTFSEFLEEAKRIRVLRTVHYTNRETKQSILDKGLRSGTRSDGTYHDKGQSVVYTVPKDKSRTGSDYGDARVNFRVVNPKVTTIDSPKNYGNRFKNWMKNASDEDLAKNKDRPVDSFKQSRSAIKSGAKVVRVPDAHGGHDEPKKGNKSSYILLDKDLANKSIDRNPSPTLRSSDKPKRTRTAPKKKS